MKLEIDNKGAIDLANNWSIGGRMRHVEVWQYFLCNLKEQGIIKTSWCSGNENKADIFTKNLPGPPFKKHTTKFCREDQY